MDRDYITPLLSPEEIERINTSPRRDRNHPLNQFLFPQQNKSEVYYNTNRALRYISQDNSAWLQSIKSRLCNIDDYSAPVSALGEIRAFGYLLSANLNVAAIPESDESSPDFKVEHNNKTIIIETHCKQYDSREARALADFNNESIQYPERGGVIVREHGVTPFGRPGREENVAENVISRLTQIKQEEHQFNTKDHCILWLDFQDTVWYLTMNKDRACPINTFRGELYAGEIWYSLYGYPGLPIFEGETPGLRGIRHTVRMRHKGRFSNNSKIDAIVYSFPRSTIVFENIFSKKPIPFWFWELFVNVPWFQYEYSRMNWPANKLRKAILIDLSTIKAFDRMLENKDNKFINHFSNIVEKLKGIYSCIIVRIKNYKRIIY